MYFTDDRDEFARNDAITDAKSGEPYYSRYSVGVNGSCSIYDPPISYWCSESPVTLSLRARVVVQTRGAHASIGGAHRRTSDRMGPYRAHTV